MSVRSMLRSVLRVVAPEGTIRRRIVRVPVRVLRSVKHRGLHETARIVRSKIRHRLIRTEQDRLQQWYVESTPSASDLHAQRQRTWPAHAPRFTLLIPVTRDGAAHSRATFLSLAQQTYPHWNVVLVADSEQHAILTGAVSLLGNDRVIAETLSASGRSDEALASALRAATGDFVAVLPLGDRLAPHALAEFADNFLNHPDCDVAYCDEDCFSPQHQRRHGLRLKPAWSPEMLLGFNYIGRLCVMRRTALVEAGGFDALFKDAQEYDALLRLSERTDRIRRLPRCLYHQRQEPSPRLTIATTLDESRLQAKALREHFQRRGIEAEIRTMPGGMHRPVWPLVNPPLVSIIIPTLNNLSVLKQCIDDLRFKTDYPRLEIILVDNNSTDPAVHRYYQELTAAGAATIVPYHRDFNYSEACNTGARLARGEILLFLNNDISVLHRDWLEEMVRYATLPGVGCVGTKLLYPNGIVQHAGVLIGLHLCGLVYNRTPHDHWDMFGSSDMYRNLSAIMGACQMIPRRVFDEVGGFDERYRIANSDVAICLRAIKAGYRVVYTPHAALYHHEGYTRGKVNPVEDIEMTARDLQDLDFVEDPYFHPALSAHHAVPTLRLFPEQSPSEFLARQVDELNPIRSVARLLDIYDDVAVRRAFPAIESTIKFPTWTQQEVASDDWGAARFALHLIRSSTHLRKRFPRALSDGVDGDYCRWLCDEATQRFGFPRSAVTHIRNAFLNNPAAKVRQLYEFRADLRQAFPVAMLPTGRRGFLEWLLNHGRTECGLRNEQIWWFMVETAEDPLRELVDAYLISPDWQAYFPEALTDSGWLRFSRWVMHRYGLHGDRIALTGFESPLAPLEQLRAAYDARGRWRLKFPHAFQNEWNIRALVTWLQQDQGWEKGAAEDAWIERVATAASQPLPSPRGVNILGHFNYPSGLQVSVRSITESLRLLGVPVSCRDVPVELATDAPDRRTTLGLEIHDVTVIHVQPEPLWDTAFARAGLHPARDRYRIGMWYWEFGEIPPEWSKAASEVQELWAPTRFIADALARVTDLPITPTLPGVRLGQVADVPRAKYGIPEDKFLFLFMYDMNSIQERKNPLGLIEAFRTAFRPDDAAHLVIKVSRGKNNPVEFGRLTHAARRANIQIIDETIPRADAYGLVAACDCYVSLHRSEGLGLTMAEAMLLGKPVIATGYSGNVDFMSAQDSRLVGYKLVPLEHDILPYKRGYLWAEPSTEEAGHWMRWMFENQEEAKLLGSAARTAAVQRLSPEAAGKRMVTRLLQIEGVRTGEQRRRAA